MEFHATPSYGETYNKVTVTGPASLDRLLSLLQVLAIDSRASKHRLLMLDLRSSQTRLGFTERLRLAEEAARKLAHLRGFALVVPQERAGADAKASLPPGAPTRVFGSEDEAVEWLTGTSKSGADSTPAAL
jgi:hypothetical protein